MTTESLTPLLSCTGVRVRRGARVVLDGVDLCLAPGEVHAAIGPNGAGKTTLLRAAAGLCECEGDIRVGGHPVAAMAARERARHIAYVPQQSPLDAALPVCDIVAQGRLAHRSVVGSLTRQDRDAIARAVAETGIEDLLPRLYTQLSMGERRRVLLARALATEARMLLLDEPTASLDLRGVLALFALLKRLAAEGCGVLVVLHQLHEVAAVAHTATLLDHGRVARQGPVALVLAAEAIRAVFGVELTAAPVFAYTLATSGTGAHRP